MITGFEKIVEERIRKAMKKGVFKDLPGEGKPLEFTDDSRIPEDLRLAYKILKNADFTPQELEIKKEIRSIEELLSGMDETAEKYKLLKKLNFMILKLNTISNRATKYEVPQRYEEKLIDRFGDEKS